MSAYPSVAPPDAMPAGEPGAGGGNGAPEGGEENMIINLMNQSLSVALKNHGVKTFNKISTSSFSQLTFTDYPLVNQNNKTYLFDQDFARMVVMTDECTLNVQMICTSSLPDPEVQGGYLPVSSCYQFMGMEFMFKDTQLTLNNDKEYTDYNLEQGVLKSTLTRLMNDKMSQKAGSNLRPGIPTYDPTYPPQQVTDMDIFHNSHHGSMSVNKVRVADKVGMEMAKSRESVLWDYHCPTMEELTSGVRMVGTIGSYFLEQMRSRYLNDMKLRFTFKLGEPEDMFWLRGGVAAPKALCPVSMEPTVFQSAFNLTDYFRDVTVDALQAKSTITTETGYTDFDTYTYMPKDTTKADPFGVRVLISQAPGPTGKMQYFGGDSHPLTRSLQLIQGRPYAHNDETDEAPVGGYVVWQGTETTATSSLQLKDTMVFAMVLGWQDYCILLNHLKYTVRGEFQYLDLPFTTVPTPTSDRKDFPQWYQLLQTYPPESFVYGKASETETAFAPTTTIEEGTKLAPYATRSGLCFYHTTHTDCGLADTTADSTYTWIKNSLAQKANSYGEKINVARQHFCLSCYVSGGIVKSDYGWNSKQIPTWPDSEVCTLDNPSFGRSDAQAHAFLAGNKDLIFNGCYDLVFGSGDRLPYQESTATGAQLGKRNREVSSYPLAYECHAHHTNNPANKKLRIFQDTARNERALKTREMVRQALLTTKIRRTVAEMTMTIVTLEVRGAQAEQENPAMSAASAQLLSYDTMSIEKYFWTNPLTFTTPQQTMSYGRSWSIKKPNKHTLTQQEQQSSRKMFYFIRELQSKDMENQIATTLDEFDVTKGLNVAHPMKMDGLDGIEPLSVLIYSQNRVLYEHSIDFNISNDIGFVQNQMKRRQALAGNKEAFGAPDLIYDMETAKEFYRILWINTMDMEHPTLLCRKEQQVSVNFSMELKTRLKSGWYPQPGKTSDDYLPEIKKPEQRVDYHYPPRTTTAATIDEEPTFTRTSTPTLVNRNCEELVVLFHNEILVGSKAGASGNSAILSKAKYRMLADYPGDTGAWDNLADPSLSLQSQSVSFNPSVPYPLNPAVSGQGGPY